MVLEGADLHCSRRPGSLDVLAIPQGHNREAVMGTVAHVILILAVAIVIAWGVALLGIIGLCVWYGTDRRPLS